MRNPHARATRVVIALLAISSLLFMPTRRAPRAQARQLSADASNGQISEDATMKPRARDAYAQLPLSFEPNHGQTDRRVKFLSRTAGYTLFLTQTEAVLTLRSAAAKAQDESGPGFSSQAKNASPVGHHLKPAVLRMRFVGADTRAKVEGQEQLMGRSNYLTGSNQAKWLTDIPNYAKVKYEGVYPGVDLSYYGNGGRLEYDFRLAPGANAESIRLAFDGSEKIRLDESGALVVHAGGAEIRQPRPFVYQEVDGVRREIPGHYVLKGRSEVGFEVAQYDKELPLVIDPVLWYSIDLGGFGTDRGQDIAVDSGGNTYITGFTNSATFPGAGFQSLRVSGFDAYVMKLSATTNNAQAPTLLYTTFLGGGGTDQAFGIGVDSSGNAYVAGKTNSTDFPTSSNAIKKTLPVSDCGLARLAQCSDAFVTKLTSSGTIAYSTYFGGLDNDEALDIFVTPSGSAYLTGDTNSTNFPVAQLSTSTFLDHPVQTTKGGGTDAFVTKLNSFGGLLYSTYLGGSGNDIGHGITVGNVTATNGDVIYVTGETASDNFPVRTVPPICPVPDFSGLGFNQGLSCSPGGIGGGGLSCQQGGIGSTPVGNCGGLFNSGCLCQNVQGNQPGIDAFVAEINPNKANGSDLVSSFYLGGSGTDQGFALITIGNEVIVTGTTNSADFLPGGLTVHGNSDVFVSDIIIDQPSFLFNGIVFTTLLGGSGDESGLDIKRGPANSIWVTGRTTSTDFPVTSDALQTVPGGGSSTPGTSDSFVTALNSNGTAINFSTYLGGSSNDTGHGLALDTAGNVYLAGDTDSLNFPAINSSAANGGGTDAFALKIGGLDLPPSISISLRQFSIWPANHKLLDVGLQASATDDHDPNLTVTVKVLSNEAVSSDAVFTAGRLLLRAERGGAMGARIYLIVVTATDSKGHESRQCSAVVVPHDASKAALAEAKTGAAAAISSCLNTGEAPSYNLIGQSP